MDIRNIDGPRSHFILLSALGVLRFPGCDRIHAATKASSFGVALMLIGISIWIPTPYIIIENPADYTLYLYNRTNRLTYDWPRGASAQY